MTTSNTPAFNLSAELVTLHNQIMASADRSHGWSINFADLEYLGDTVRYITEQAAGNQQVDDKLKGVLKAVLDASTSLSDREGKWVLSVAKAAPCMFAEHYATKGLREILSGMEALEEQDKDTLKVNICKAIMAG